jgi:hypothetical protein
LTKGQILKVLQTSWRPEGVHVPVESFDAGTVEFISYLFQTHHFEPVGVVNY